jgi:S1-C subfamily serine protease
MDSERGVYIIETDKNGSGLCNYLNPNDVILGFAGKTINSIEELKKAVENADFSQPLEIVVFRNQKEEKIIIRESLE